MELLERAARYISKIESVEGQDGSGACFHAACVLAEGFDLLESDVRFLLEAWNRTNATPPWSEKELKHKVEDAIKAAGRSNKRGYLAADSSENHPIYRALYENAPAEIKSISQFLQAAFEPGEHIGIAKSFLNKSGKSVPASGGLVLSREKWLDLAARKNDSLESWFPPSDGGVFCRINPLKPGGKRDEDVTAYRHALLEFDQGTESRQWSALKALGAPITAVIHSGRRGLHAWVRVDAQNRAEYDSRVQELLRYTPEADKKDKNVSRFSRLPGVARGEGRQRLIALRVGAKDWQSWVKPPLKPETSSEAPQTAPRLTLSGLAAFDTAKDPNSVLGRRWLCKGGSCVWVGASGVGKSSLSMQAALSWAAGKPFFGISGVRPLKSLIVQAENDEGDLAEEVQGVARGLGLGPEDLRRLDGSIALRREQTRVGLEFAKWIREEIRAVKPDLVWVDPLMAYFGADINSQKECAYFFRTLLNPIAEEFGIVWNVVHHTAKPPKDGRGLKGWGLSDWLYIGSGSAEVANWARAAVYLRPVADGFRLLLPKRGARAGLLDHEGKTVELTKEGYPIRQGRPEEGIIWKYITDEEKAAEEDERLAMARAGRIGTQYSVKVDPAGFQKAFAEYEGDVNQICVALGISKTTFWRKKKEMEAASAPA